MEFLYNKIITTYQDSKAYKYAILDPLAALGKLLHKL